jgi:hypothetical protein
MAQDAVIRQYVYEAESWGRFLAFFRQENVYFKTRLAETVNNSSDTDALDTAERFHEEFLSQDGMISFLSDELRKQTKLLERDLYEDGELFKEVIQNQKKLRKDIKKAEDLFAKVKNEFGEYLSDSS